MTIEAADCTVGTVVHGNMIPKRCAITGLHEGARLPGCMKMPDYRIARMCTNERQQDSAKVYGKQNARLCTKLYQSHHGVLDQREALICLR